MYFISLYWQSNKKLKLLIALISVTNYISFKYNILKQQNKIIINMHMIVVIIIALGN